MLSRYSSVLATGMREDARVEDQLERETPRGGKSTVWTPRTHDGEAGDGTTKGRGMAAERSRSGQDLRLPTISPSVLATSVTHVPLAATSANLLGKAMDRTYFDALSPESSPLPSKSGRMTRITPRTMAYNHLGAIYMDTLYNRPSTSKCESPGEMRGEGARGESEGKDGGLVLAE